MIITLGPTGTYSEIATKKLFPDEEIHLVDSFFEIFTSKKPQDILVLPLENSIYGSIIDVWEAIVKQNLFISKTITLDITHSLGAQNPLQIKKIIGHPQALGQCNKFLSANFPHLKIEAATSTGKAIEAALKSSEFAAIGNAEIMEKMGLTIIKNEINDVKNNRTLFGIISKTDLFPQATKTKTVILLEPTNDHPGLLLEILKIIAQNQINLTRLESRPQGHKLGLYKFFLDLETTTDSKYFHQILSDLKIIGHKVKVIGSF